MNQLLTNFGVDWKLLLAQMVNFAILLYVLKRFAYSPVIDMLHKRQEIVRKGMEDASQAEKSLVEAKSVAEELRNEAKSDAFSLLESTRREADDFMLQSKEAATVEKNRIVAKAQKEIDTAQEASEQELRKKTVDLVIAGVRSVLKDEIDPALNSRIISRLTHTS